MKISVRTSGAAVRRVACGAATSLVLLLLWASPLSAQTPLCIEVGTGRSETRPPFVVPREDVVAALAALEDVYVVGVPGARCPSPRINVRLSWVVGLPDRAGVSVVTVTLGDLESRLGARARPVEPMTLVGRVTTVGPTAGEAVARAIARLIELRRAAIEDRFPARRSGGGGDRALDDLITPLAHEPARPPAWR